MSAATTSVGSPRTRGLSSLACAAVLLLGGCVSYGPAQLSAMQTIDLCETIDVQSYNLTPESRGALQSELSRRGESCALHSAAVEQRRRDFLDRETYGKQSP